MKDCLLLAHGLFLTLALGELSTIIVLGVWEDSVTEVKSLCLSPLLRATHRQHSGDFYFRKLCVVSSAWNQNERFNR